MHPTIRQILAVESAPATPICAQGWVRTRRDSKEFSFLEINDGSCLNNLQCVVDAGIPGSEHIQLASTGAAIRIDGQLIPSPAAGQKWEMRATCLTLLGAADPDFPLQKKGHSVEFLRGIAHLRARTNLFGAVFRTRSRLAQAVHRFFDARQFHYIHTPIITTSDCEGAGEMFRVTTLKDGGKPEDDFFGKPAYLTVSGQLEAETLACGLGRVYTFGPTFRAENSNTTRHVAEFWMIEPEMAFCDLGDDMDLAEDFVKDMVGVMLEECADDLAFFTKFQDKELTTRLQGVREKPFVRLPYTEAVEILQKCGRAFEYPVTWGMNLQAEHERYLTEEHFKSPVTVFNYPKVIKPFYMRANDDGLTVTAMDLLVPGIGELVGGAQREERADVLAANFAVHGLDAAAYAWYLDLRRFGTVPHAGFGLGFERLLMFVTGVKNIRDVIAFPRTPGNAGF